MDSTDYESKPGNGMAVCEGLLNKLVMLDEMDLRDLSEKDPDWKVRKVNDVKTSLTQFEESCAYKYDREIMRSLLAKFEFALLKLAYAAKNSGDSDRLGSPFQDFVSKYSDEEFDSISKLEQFSGIDALTSTNVKEALDRKEGKIYDIIKQWYNSQMYEFNLLIDSAPQSKMRNTIKKALIEKYNHRFSVIREGVVQYMSYDSIAPAKLFNQYDDVASRFYEAQNSWDEITKNFNSIPINEIETRYYEVENQESDMKERITKIQDSLRDSSNFQEQLVKLKEMENQLLVRHRTFQSEIEAKVGEISVLIDRGNSLIQQVEIRAATETDPKSLAIFRSQVEYLRKRMDEIHASTKRLAEIQDEIRRHILMIEDKLEKASELTSAQDSSSLIRIDDAVADGVSFVYRFRRKMEESLPFTLKDLYEGGNIKVNSHEDLESARHLKVSPEDSENFMQADLYNFRRKRVLGSPFEVSIGFVLFTHRNLFQKDLLDARPISLSEFLEIFEVIRNELGSAEKTAYIGIYSPTGFEERVVSRIKGDNKIFLDNIFLFLIDQKFVDARSNRKINDEFISKLFNLELGQEKEERARKAIREYIAKTDEVSLDRISKETGISSDLLEYIADGMRRNREIDLKKVGRVKVVTRR